MRRVGLTGNIAAGKSSAARVWESLGATVIDADRLARQATEPGSPALGAIIGTWGPGVLDAEGALDRAALRRIVFRDPAERLRLERIVHPAVAALRDQAYGDAEARGEAVVVADIPLLFEAGLVTEFDRIVLVDAPEATRLRRLVEERGMDPAEARRMIAAQMPAEAKRARADVIIDNSGSRAELERRAAEVWRQIQSWAR